MKVDTFNKILVWTSIFSIAIFLIDVSFFSVENNNKIEKEYIEKQLDRAYKENIDNSLIEKEEYKEVTNNNEILDKITREEVQTKIDKLKEIIRKQKEEQLKSINKKEEIELKSAPIINIQYIKNDFEKTINKEIKIGFYSILKSNIFNLFYNKINIKLNEKEIDIRGKMKSKTILIYGVNKLGSKEFTSVFIHEFGHFIDLYYLNNFLNNDISNQFYDISWKTTKIIKGGQSIGDFVSGYSMTNKYEDFAETFTYYVLHNKDFVNKLKKSEVLEKKYEFFSKNIFKDNSFLGTNFSGNKVVKDYYWDITKIEINLKNFLKYIKS